MDKKQKTEQVSSSIKNLADYYKDDKQKSVNALKEDAKSMKEKYSLDTPKPVRVAKIVFGTLLAGAFAFGWLLVMLLIVSFVFLSYVHITFDKMLVISAIFGVAIATVYGVFKVKNMLKSQSK